MKLTIESVAKAFAGNRVLQDASLTASPGEITVITGSNASGKTTLFNVITGFYRQDRGRVLLGNPAEPIDDLLPDARVRRGVGRTFQDPRVFPDLTVKENLLCGHLAARLGDQSFPLVKLLRRFDVDERMNRLLRFGALAEKKESLAANLSFGQRKILDIVRLLAAEKKLLLLDEPFAGLDRNSRSLLEKILFELKSRHVTVVLISHDENHVQSVADHVYLLRSGILEPRRSNPSGKREFPEGLEEVKP